MAADRPNVTDDLPDAPRWQGINHLALVTPDMDATVRFYVGVLGMRLAATTMAGPDAPLLLRDGPRQHRRLLRGGGRRDVRQAGRAVRATAPSSSTTSRSTSPTSTRSRCCASGCSRPGSEVTEVVDHGFIRSMYFTDPNGIALEASWWVVDGTGRPTDYTDAALFGDPDPVPAVAELRAGGLDDLPRTRLT